MKQLLLSTVFFIQFCTSFAQGLTPANIKSIQSFITHVKNNEVDKVVSSTVYPLRRELPIPPIKNKQEFIKRYADIFDAKLVKMLASSNPYKDWRLMRDGFMLLDGEVWLDDTGQLIAVNYKSQKETILQKEYDRKDREQLHASLRKFSKRVLILETATYRIRVDELSEDVYRYAAWKVQAKMSDKPDLVLNNGVRNSAGSAGNHDFQFKRGEYTYICDINVLGYEATPAYLIVKQGDKEILNQDAIRGVKIL